MDYATNIHIMLTRDLTHDVMVVQELLESGSIDKTKATLVVATGTVGNGGKTHKPFLLFLHAAKLRVMSSFL